MPVGTGTGSPTSPIMIVGEAWGEEEEKAGAPFVGRSGMELNRMLHEAKILRSDCYVTNVVNARPPGNNLDLWLPERKKDITSDMVELRGSWVKPILREGYEQLKREIALVSPKLIIALGNTALWALTGRRGITKWRGSLMDSDGGVRVIPTYHPAAVLRMPEWRPIAVHDLSRAGRELMGRTLRPEWRFITRPSMSQVLEILEGLRARADAGDTLTLDFDIETVKGHIRCFAISWTRTDALCVPLMLLDSAESYWTVEEEGTILWHTWKLFTHPRVGLRGQNLLFDFQYVLRHWHYVPNLAQDTMLTHHVLWAGMPKALAFQASMYCTHYVYWKDMVKHSEAKEGE